MYKLNYYQWQVWTFWILFLFHWSICPYISQYLSLVSSILKHLFYCFYSRLSLEYQLSSPLRFSSIEEKTSLPKYSPPETKLQAVTKVHDHEEIRLNSTGIKHSDVLLLFLNILPHWLRACWTIMTTCHKDSYSFKDIDPFLQEDASIPHISSMFLIAVLRC